MKNQKKWIGLVFVLAVLMSMIPIERVAAASYKATKFKSFSSVINARGADHVWSGSEYAYTKIKTKHGTKKALFVYGSGCTADCTGSYIYFKHGKTIYNACKNLGIPQAISKNKKYIYVHCGVSFGGFILRYSSKSGKYEEYKSITTGKNLEQLVKKARQKYGLSKENINYKYAEYKGCKLPQNCTVLGSNYDNKLEMIVNVEEKKIHLDGFVYLNENLKKIKAKWYKCTEDCKILISDEDTKEFTFKEYFSEMPHLNKDGKTLSYIGATINISKGKISQIEFGS